MGKESEGSDQKKTAIAIVGGVVIVIVVAVCIFVFTDKTTQVEQGIKIQVCEVDTKLIVVIDESDFNPIVYSKNLDDCK